MVQPLKLPGTFRTNFQIEKEGTSTLKEIMKNIFKSCPIIEETIVQALYLELNSKAHIVSFTVTDMRINHLIR